MFYAYSENESNILECDVNHSDATMNEINQQKIESRVEEKNHHFNHKLNFEIFSILCTFMHV